MRYFFNLPGSVVVALGLIFSSLARANDNSQPLSFGTTLNISGTDYTWVSATDDGTYRCDAYIDSSSAHNLTITTLLEVDSLALVNGTSANGQIAGHLYYGSYTDNQINTSENGYFPDPDGWFAGYTSKTSNYSYTLDLVTGERYSSGYEQYDATDSGGNYNYIYTWDETANTWSKLRYGNFWWQSSTPSAHFGEVPAVLGLEHQFTSSDYLGPFMYHIYSDGSMLYETSDYYSDYYVSPSGGTLMLNYIQDIYANIYEYRVSGWDPDYGTYSATQPGGAAFNWSTLIWNNRTGPTFASNNLWIKQAPETNYHVLTWQSGVLETNGTITDTFTSQEGLTVQIVCNLRDYVNGTTYATVSVDNQNVGTLANNSGFGMGGGWDIQATDPGTIVAEPYFNGSTTLWVNGTPFAFQFGHIDPYGARQDTYIHEGLGTITLAGSDGNPLNADVTVNITDFSGVGSYSSGFFYVTGVTILTTAALGPEAFWVRGQLYKRSGVGSNTFNSTYYSFSLSAQDEGTTNISGTDSFGAFNGTFSNGQTGVFLINDENEVLKVPVIPANADGSMRLSGEVRPGDLPPAVMVVSKVLVFLGTAPDDTAVGQVSAYYGRMKVSENQPEPVLVKIRADETGDLFSVTHTHYLALESKTGAYHKQTHLFQTGLNGSLPMPLYAVHGPCHNSGVWNLPEPEGDWPASFLVGGDIWRFKGMSGATPLYQGYYDDQSLSVTGPATPGGNLNVTVTGLPGGESTGHLNNVRGSVRLANGTMVYSGDYDGQVVNPGPSSALHTIAGDLDITGNIVSFGALNGSAAVAGVTMRFEDNDVTASLGSALARPNVQWMWSRASDMTAQSASLPVMNLTHDGSSNAILRIFGANGVDVVLTPSPNGTSIISSALEVRKDVNLLEDLHIGGTLSLTGGIVGNLSVAGNLGVSGIITMGQGQEVVLTQSSADSRYVRSGATTPITIASGAVINGAASFNGSFSAASGATVTGNTELYGNLTSTGAANIGGDVTVSGAASMTGNTSVGGTLSADGNFTANAQTRIKGAATLEFDFIVRGVFDGNPEEKRVVLQPNQKVLIPEAGDISMGIFRDGPLPETVPSP